MGRAWRQQPNSVYIYYTDISTGGVRISYLMCQRQTALGHHTNIPVYYLMSEEIKWLADGLEFIPELEKL